ncbi:MAG: hypothetical protein V2A79_01180 [Planctomycetota bacterium]
MRKSRIVFAATLVSCPVWIATSHAQSPFAATVVGFSPAPGQFVNEPSFNDPDKALGAPSGGGTHNADNTKLVSLGGFGGSITLKFDHTVWDDPANPRCLDAIVFGNAYWVGYNSNLHWAECGYVEISRDLNSNGQADDPWYLIPGSHITDLEGQWETQTWDDIGDVTHPPDNPNWIPPGCSGTWDTQGYRLPADVFDVPPLINPNGLEATEEGIYGYADFTPVLILGDLDADNTIDDPEMSPEEFYTVPDDPLEVGITPGSGGGDAFDIAWAIDPATGEPAGLDGFDFIRVTNGVNHVTQDVGEVSSEIGGVADVAPGLMGDGDWNGSVDLDDLVIFNDCTTGPDGYLGLPGCGCRVMDFDGDDDVDLRDFAEWQIAFTAS